MKAACLLTLGLLLVLRAEPARGCSCRRIDPSEGFDRAQAVFSGKVIKAQPHQWAVSVDKVWKGEVEEKISLFDAMPGTSCESSFKEGVSYLFLVDVKKSGGGTVYSPQVCNWTTSLKSEYVVFGVAYSRVEDLVLKGRGEGEPPMKNRE